MEEPDTQRPRGIFTSKDREYLRYGPPEDMNENTRRSRRKRIRDRAKNGILDFNYLENLPKHERREIFELIGEEGDLKNPELYAALENVFSFPVTVILDFELRPEDFVEQSLEYTIQDYGVVQHGRFVDVDVSVEIEMKEQRDISTLWENYQEGELSMEEIREITDGRVLNETQFEMIVESSTELEDIKGEARGNEEEN